MVVSDQHDIWAISVIPIVIIVFIVLATLNITGNLHPWTWVVVVPAFVFSRCHFITTSVYSTEKTFVKLEEFWVVGSQSLHPLFH